ncbi:MAG: NAD(P)-dependent oxidoreductase [Acidobacteriia bacterium]|nr:NAD(P)-dependent oxidoreductase [Terriglobia bacterium]MYK11702.1 NAD(P)-dependent oxidoreductase [Terriglobia bacterium]
MRRLDGDVLVLGVGGKMGPTLARLARRAADRAARPRRVIGVARFSDPSVRPRLERWGVETIRADLLSRGDVAALPHTPNVIFMAGHKFGTAGNPSRTWAANAYLPTLAAETFPRSRTVVFSSGNVYPFAAAPGPGPSERDPTGPVGEYAQSVLGRERLFEYFSELHGTPAAILRLNYAVEPRYGVLRDIADRVRNRSPIDLATGYVNVIWQRDANSIALRLLEHCSTPPLTLNVTGTEALSVRAIAERFGRVLGVEPIFSGSEEPTALLSDARQCAALFGPPPTGLDEMIDRIAEWMLAGGSGLGKPTHFEERGGSF